MTIRQIVRRISEHSKYLSREVGLTVPQLLCLKAVGDLSVEHSEITVVLVSTHVQLSPATVSRIVDRLTRAGLLLRERSSTDRRRVSLTLTEQGKARYASLPTPLQEQFIERFDALPTSEQEGLLRSLSQIAELMDATDLDAAPMLAPGSSVRAGKP